MIMNDIIYPQPLLPGDTVAILSPASEIRNDYVEGAVLTLRQRGFNVIVEPHCKGCCGTFSGPLADRIADFYCAVVDPKVKAILCSRGGYGVVHLLEHLEPGLLKNHPKWIVGFSDISALHAWAAAEGVASVHASMCKHLTEHPSDFCSLSLLDILEGKMPSYTVASHPFSRCGEAEAQIFGGNLAVLSGLISTRFDILRPDTILFIEDVSEAISRVERMLYTLRLNGTLARLKGLVVGRFTDYKPSKDFTDMNEMIRRMAAGYDFPVAFDFPIGHIDDNHPIVEGAHAVLKVAPDATTLTLSK